MKKLIQGVREFQKSVFPNNKRLFENLADGQHPLALFITCADSRIVPQMLTQTEPGELFILRTAGNIIPPYGAVIGGEAATIEYAVSVLKIRDIIVCGHSRCGAMAALYDAKAQAQLPAVRALLKHAEATKQIVQRLYPDLEDPRERLRMTIEKNVLVQLANLRTHPSVASAIAAGEVNLHGWVYHFENGQVQACGNGEEHRPNFDLLELVAN